MLAHAASAQGISAVENICGRSHTLNHLSVPAACFTHPEARFHGTLGCSCPCQPLGPKKCNEQSAASMSHWPFAKGNYASFQLRMPFRKSGCLLCGLCCRSALWA